MGDTTQETSYYFLHHDHSSNFAKLLKFLVLKMETGRQVFSVDLLERYAAKGHGVITCMAAGNDVIVLGTSKGWIIRHDFEVGDSYDIDLSTGRAGEQSIRRVFVDPRWSHCIATIVGGGGADTFYTHAKWTRPHVLSKLKGLVVNAVAWNRQQITEASTREVILGTDNGQLHEIAMETASTSNGTKHYMMAVTPTRLYSFSGIGSLDVSLIRSMRFMELPVNCISLSSKEELYILNGFLEPVKVVNRISEQIIEELQFDETPESMSRGIIGLCSDASAGLFYAYDQNSIFQVSVNDEGRDMWKVYLDLKEYAAALANCWDPFQRDQVYLAQAEAAFSAKDFPRAASFYAKIYYILSFEEITLKFISINEQQGEAKKALEVLQKPAVPIDLQYKFAPDLIMLDAYETVESWMTTKNLNPRKLIPAMMRYSSEPHANINNFNFQWDTLTSSNFQGDIGQWQKWEDDSALLRFLQCKFGKGRLSGPEFFYDPKYALRLCLKEKRMRGCVHIYSMMSMHEEAVALALQVDPELAKAEADKVEDDEDLREKLWLMVAKHVVEQEKGTKRENIRKAIAFLKETNELLKIEDILSFFLDFALINDFKEAICSSLEDYNKQIEQLKQEMNDATHGADNIRNNISALAQRYAVIDCDEDCGVCQRKILTAGWDHRMAGGYTSVDAMAPFYVFPCGHAFHAQCLIAHVTRCTHRDQAKNIRNKTRNRF
ncbi:unnamed protein product [Camellia sinensis]